MPSENHTMYHASSQPDMNGLINITTLVYGLQAVSLFTLVPMFIGLIINYWKRLDVADTWLASHFTWQIRSFWYGLLWYALGLLLLFFLVGRAILLVNTLWLVYRITKGWWRLYKSKPMYG